MRVCCEGVRVCCEGVRVCCEGARVSCEGVRGRYYYYLLFIAFIERYCLLSSRLTAHMSHVILNEWLYPFIARIINIHGSGVLVALFGCCMAAAT